MPLINLDYTGNYNRFDTENMYGQIISLTEQIEKSYFEDTSSKYAKYYKNIKQIFICGMGGSAIAGDIFRSLFEDKLPIEVIKDYYLPRYINESTLGICCSYSGNTVETISCFNELREKGAQIAMITSGGILKHYSSEEGYLIKMLPTGYQPRAAIGFLFFSLLRIFEELEIIEKQKINVKISLLNIRNKLKLIEKNVNSEKNLAKKIAQKLNKKIPIIYSSNPKLFPLAYRFKCQINENAKQHAFSNTFSEMNHNEIEGWEWENIDYVQPIFIIDYNEDEKYLKRLRAFQEIYKKNKIDFIELYTEGKTLLGKTFSTILFCDMVSYYLAILNRVNPSRINYIDYLKSSI